MVRFLFVLSFVLVALGCGARSASSSSATTPAPATDTTSTDRDQAATQAPCTIWDPSADPTVAPADVAAPPETARHGAADLRFCVLREGQGARPTHDDTVLVHYTGWTTDGHMFDSSHTRGEPTALPVHGVIAGWTQALTHMRVGEIRRLWIPEALAYRGQAGAPAGMLVFDVELVDIQ